MKCPGPNCGNEVARLWKHPRIQDRYPQGLCTTCYVIEKATWPTSDFMSRAGGFTTREEVLADLPPTTTPVAVPPPQTTTSLPPPAKNPAAVVLGRAGGQKAGVARAARLSPEQRRAIGQKAAHARWHPGESMETKPAVSSEPRVKRKYTRRTWRCSCGDSHLLGITCKQCGEVRPIPRQTQVPEPPSPSTVASPPDITETLRPLINPPLSLPAIVKWLRKKAVSLNAVADQLESAVTQLESTLTGHAPKTDGSPD